ncbi:MAG: hypothetical protein VYA69_03450 [Gemmatimonadota bacterium]|nr:hypothetical protein [Gemmatimonadota bacterium]
MKLRSKPLATLCSLVILTVTAVPAVYGQSSRTVDFFVAENPRALTIYNRYQQKISLEESRLFRPFVPMEVVEKNATLSDNFTRCMRVKIGVATFYLLRESDNALMNDHEAGYTGAFRGCLVVDDTVQVMLDNGHTVSPRFSAADEISLRKNTRVRRLFRKDRSDFVQILGGTARYGWAYFNSRKQNSTWKIYKDGGPVFKDVFPERVSSRVHTRIREVNGILRNLFKELNAETGGARPVPQWQVDITDNQIVCTMNDPVYAKRFSDSMQYIINDLNNVVRGTNMAVRYTDGVIEIKTK